MVQFLHVRAPFAAFRPLAVGWFRPSTTIITPSAAYGLLLNFAAIDSRLPEHSEDHDGDAPTTYTRSDLPPVKLAIGIPDSGRDALGNLPLQQTSLQQLHNYPVGKDAGVPSVWTKGNKNNITPVKREFLSDLDFVIGVDAEKEFQNRIQDGLHGKFNQDRYGLPFLGDNAFLIDSVTVSSNAPACHWYECLEGAQGKQSRINEAVRLTIEIDRKGFSGTRSSLYLPSQSSTELPSDLAWTAVGSQPSAER